MIKTVTVSAGEIVLRLTCGDRRQDTSLLIIKPRRESGDGDFEDYAQISIFDRASLEAIRDFLSKHLPKELKAV